MSSKLPSGVVLPVESEWPIYISTSLVIDAPRQKVWDVFTDFAAHPKWNPYWRECTPLDANKKPLLAGTQLASGHRLALKLHLPPTLDDTVPTRNMVEALSHVAAPSHLAWGANSMPLLFRTQRWHVFTDVDGDSEAGGKTKLVVISAVGGGLGRLMPKGMQEELAQSIRAMNEALKKRCEGEGM
ncbi:hypothetical protein C8F01DRAFT_32624 [Mycena amicta]|nr:hypothetical protein C8F01DRAFT_32624 [Mycena amicta]